MAGTILIIDDMATNRIVLKVRLVQACYEVITAASLAEGFAQARRKHPDLILFSSDLEGRGPAPVLTALAEDSSTCGVPAVAITGPDNMVARSAALAAGAAEALSRPVDEQLLLARLRALLRNGTRSGAGTGAAVSLAADEPSLPPARIALIASDKSLTAAWRRALAARLPDRLIVLPPERALVEAAGPDAPELFLIAADLDNRSDGLRLMSELRARPGSREAGFCIALDRTNKAEAAVALDLGADEVLPLDFFEPSRADEAALRLRLCLMRQMQAQARRKDLAARLRDAMIDPLTGLANRRAALPEMERISREAEDSGLGYAVLVIDLDHFKCVNDRHGHAAGDAVLAEAARRIARSLGPDDLVARIGGEEFMAVLPDIGRTKALSLAQAICDRMASDPIRLPDSPFICATTGAGRLSLTASVGLALGDGQEPADHVLERADRALLAAKAGGRNRVSFSLTQAVGQQVVGQPVIGQRVSVA